MSPAGDPHNFRGWTIGERKWCGCPCGSGHHVSTEPIAEDASISDCEFRQYLEYAWRNPNTARDAGTLRLIAALKHAQSVVRDFLSDCEGESTAVVAQEFSEWQSALKDICGPDRSLPTPPVSQDR